MVNETIFDSPQIKNYAFLTIFFQFFVEREEV